MGDGHVARLLADLELVGDGDSADLVRRLCARVPAAVAVSGAAVSVMGDAGVGVVAVSDAAAQDLEDIQLTLNEGPGLDAYANHGPVLIADLRRETRWVSYPADAVAAGARAVFGFPLQLGSIKIGALTLNRDRPGPLSTVELNRCFDVSELITHLLLIVGSDGEGLSRLWEDLDDDWTVVHQATGMASVQLGVGVDDALVRVRGHAFATGSGLVEVAREIVARDLRLRHDGNSSRD